jgi:hypothetical protein
MSKRKPVPKSLSTEPNVQGESSTGSPTITSTNTPAANNDANIPSDSPPIYSGPSTLHIPQSARPSPALQHSLIPGLPDLPWSKYQVPDSTLSSDATTLTTVFPAYSSDPRALETFLRDQANLPPKPCVRIVGTSDDGFTTFDIWINLLHYLVPRGGASQQWNYVQVDNNGNSGRAKPKRSKSGTSVNQDRQDGLRAVVERFCDDKAMIKSLTLERRVVNHNREFVEGSIRNLLAQMGYRGHVAISFTISFQNLVVQSPPKGNKFLHGVASLFVEGKKYEGVRSVWPYATLAPGEEAPGTGERICAVQSEETWWRDWRGVVALAVKAKRKGWVGVEDQIELAMMPRG